MKNGEYLGLIVMSASTEGLAAQKDHLLLIIDKQPVQCKCIPVLKTSERERERERELY
jgi:hypothetical protein